jgi:NADH:ubiquinone oxidoreductase subunit F (NADH-binding)
MPDAKIPYRVLPESGSDLTTLAAYRGAGGYSALEKAIRQMTPEEVTTQVFDAKLRGRGGAGRLTGEKWRIVRHAVSDQKYVICNAYDADERSYLSRSLMERNPHEVIEGILLAAYAVGASEAYIFTRTTFVEGVGAIQRALNEALDANLVGQDVLGTEFSCTINVVGTNLGFMGGEETVQIQALKATRPMPLQRPPFPAKYGLWEHPTAVDCIETLANVPMIVRDGAEAFKRVGTTTTPGTKILTVYGYTPGSLPQVIEVPFGTTLRQIITAAGFTPSDSDLRAIVVGGAEGGALPLAAFDTPYDYDPLEEAGAIVGSSIVELLAADTCMVHWAMERSEYLSKETCGKCVPCRVGVKRVTGLLQGIMSDLGVMGDLDVLEEFSQYIPNGSICGFGVNAPNPLKTARRYWPEHFIMHIQEQQCPTGTCIPVRSHRYVTKHVLP